MRQGQIFAGYAIERQLGQGGMGSVYLARHPRLPRLTALKLLNRELVADNEIRARFEREADLAARLDHPNIVTVFDRGVEAEQMWISMQYIDGTDAASLAPVTLPVTEALRIVADTAKALDHAHSFGVLHRDIKPANILLAEHGRVYLTDFGIARLRDDNTHLTRTGTFTATLAYASPEQLSGSPLDHRTDQYSLACTLFWLLTGSAPYAAANPAAVIQGHLMATPPSVSGRRPELNPALDQVLATAMAKRPSDRFTSCREFAEAATHALEAPWMARPASVPHASAASSPAQSARPKPSAAQPSTSHRSNRARLIVTFAVGIVIAALAAAAIFTALHRSSPGPDTGAASTSITATKVAGPTAKRATTTSATPTSSTALPTAGAALHNAFPQMVPVMGGSGSGYDGASCGFGLSNDDIHWDNLPYFGNWTIEADCPGRVDAAQRVEYIFYLYATPADVQAVLAGLLPHTTVEVSQGGKTYTRYTMTDVGTSGSTYMVTEFHGDAERERILMLTVFQTTDGALRWWNSAPLN
ncbi:serine/threonine protein kinase [Nocardia blacklockiae]|nr:serine/threonine protein kinase [Nocardia blacklockiae]